MTTSGLFPFNHADYEAEAAQAVVVMGEGLARTICIARVLVEHGRTVDLAGLDRGVGLFCAKALDLPTDAGRAIRPHLVAVLDQADQLADAIRSQLQP